ncbi:MAG: VWA domain-containing protein [Candidatus Edwardsbacteria bacterium]|nr:VWA domain-containing protein [Candidatus Edwardsbacteria bacterium]
MRFASPLYLLLLIPLVGLIWLELKKRTAAVRFSNTEFFKKNPGYGKYIKHALFVLSVAALFLMIIALARPQKGRVYEEIEDKGIDIMLCMDISGTMQAEDFSPKNRLFVAKERAKEFVNKRKGDRIGLVLFAGQALTQCPLTTDKKILSDLIDRLDFGLVADGTAIGMGLASAVGRIKDSKSKSRIIILLTDGLNNAGEVDPITAAKLAQTYGIKIYSIGVGSKGPVPFPVDDPVFGRRYAQVQLDLDMAALEGISRLTGGQSFLASDAEALKLIYDEIDRMEPTTYKVTRHTVYSEKAGIFMLAALILFLLNLLLSFTFLRRLP